jgi:hypothetical protein
VSGGDSAPGPQDLQGLCALLERAAAQARRGHDSLESRSAALEELEGRATDAMARLVAEIDEGGREIEAAGAEVLSAREGLARVLHAAEPALMAMRHALDEADAAWARARSTLQERAASQQRRTEHAWSDLATGLDALRVAPVPEGARATVSEFTGEAARATEGWSRERAALAQGCAEIGTDLADSYGEWGAESEREAEALIRGITEAALEVADFLGTDGAMQLEAAARGALGEPLAQLRATLAEAEAVIAASASAAGELTGLVPQLVICMNIIENINRLLEEKS